MTSTRVYAPEGAVGTAPLELAPAPAALQGVRVALLDNGKPNADRLLRRVGERLAARTGAMVSFDRRKENAALPCAEPLLQELTKEAELAITASAD